MYSAARLGLTILIVLSGCGTPEKQPQNVQVVRMATVLGRVTTPLAQALNKVLPEHFPARVEVQKTATTKDYVRFLQEGRIEFAIVQTDLSYLAYTQGLPDLPGPQRKLRGVAVLYTSPLHLIAARSSGVRSLKDLRGKRVFVGTDGNTTEFTTKLILEGVGLSVDAKQMPEEKVMEALSIGRLDAAFIRGNDPSPSVQRVMQAPGVSLIPIARGEVERIGSHHPFLHSASIPAGMYGDHPEIETVGTDMLLACRDELPEELVYWVARTLFDSLPALADSFPQLRRIDLEHVQASPIPLHPGASRFYRERELFQ
ncbi:MAG: TAXI family TRAP transporter solute-binding subunit [Acidobacteria bacterium]|nr:TAXI family TRAP transporter solute-binding subunit [Acidobacteriota bacterium]